MSLPTLAEYLAMSVAERAAAIAKHKKEQEREIAWNDGDHAGWLFLMREREYNRGVHPNEIKQKEIDQRKAAKKREAEKKAWLNSLD